METTIWSEADKLYVKLSGEMDHHAVTKTRIEVDGQILQKRPKTLFMDLSAIDFCDSSGLGFILGRLRQMNDRRGRVYLLNPTARIEEMLRMAGADKLLTVVQSGEAGASSPGGENDEKDGGHNR